MSRFVDQLQQRSFNDMIRRQTDATHFSWRFADKLQQRTLAGSWFQPEMRELVDFHPTATDSAFTPTKSKQAKLISKDDHICFYYLKVPVDKAG